MASRFSFTLPSDGICLLLARMVELSRVDVHSPDILTRLEARSFLASENTCAWFELAAGVDPDAYAQAVRGWLR